MWLGYSSNNTVSENIIDSSQTSGIAIEHGINNTLIGNLVSKS